MKIITAVCVAGLIEFLVVMGVVLFFRGKNSPASELDQLEDEAYDQEGE